MEIWHKHTTKWEPTQSIKHTYFHFEHIGWTLATFDHLFIQYFPCFSPEYALLILYIHKLYSISHNFHILFIDTHHISHTAVL